MPCFYYETYGRKLQLFQPVRAMKAVFVFANYGLIDHKHESGDGYDAFRALLSDQEDATAQESSLPSLHRGRHIMDDAPSMLPHRRARAKPTMQQRTRRPR